MAKASTRWNESTKRRNLKNSGFSWWTRYKSRYWRNKIKNERKKKLKIKRNRIKQLIESVLIILMIPTIFALLYIVYSISN